MEDVLRRTPIARFFDSMAVRLNGPDAEGVNLSVNFVFTDLGESHRLDIGNAVLHHRPAAPDAEADATLRITHEMVLAMVTGRAGLAELLLSDDIELEGNKLDLLKFFSLFDQPEGRFNIVTP